MNKLELKSLISEVMQDMAKESLKNKLKKLISEEIEEIKYEKKDTWVLDTTGSNLLDTLGLDYIDSTRTYSNDIREMFDANPQVAADTIRRIGHCLHSDRQKEDKVVIR